MSRTARKGLCEELRGLLRLLEERRHLIRELPPRRRLFAELVLASKEELLEAACR